MNFNFLNKKFKPIILYLPNIDDAIECDDIIKNNEEINGNNYYLLPEPLYYNETLLYRAIILKGEIIKKHKLDIGLNLYKLVNPEMCGPNVWKNENGDSLTKNIFSVNEKKYLIPYKPFPFWVYNNVIILSSIEPLGVSIPVDKKNNNVVIFNIESFNAFMELKNQNNLEEDYKDLEYKEYDILTKNKKYGFQKRIRK